MIPAEAALAEMVAAWSYDELAADQLMELLESLPEKSALVPAAKHLVRTWPDKWRPPIARFMDAYYAEVVRQRETAAEGRQLVPPAAYRMPISTVVEVGSKLIGGRQHDHRNGAAGCPICGPHRDCKQGKPCARCTEIADQVWTAVRSSAPAPRDAAA